MSKLRGIKLHFMSFCLAVFAIFSTFFSLDVSASGSYSSSLNGLFNFPFSGLDFWTLNYDFDDFNFTDFVDDINSDSYYEVTFDSILDVRLTDSLNIRVPYLVLGDRVLILGDNASGVTQYTSSSQKTFVFSGSELHSSMPVKFKGYVFKPGAPETGFDFALRIDIVSCREIALDDSQAYDKGYSDGYSAGEEFGYSDGYNNGFLDGESEGFDEGFEVGKDSVDTDSIYMEGYEAGREVAYVEGYDEGYAKGYAEALTVSDSGGQGLIQAQKSTYNFDISHSASSLSMYDFNTPFSSHSVWYEGTIIEETDGHYDSAGYIEAYGYNIQLVKHLFTPSQNVYAYRINIKPTRVNLTKHAVSWIRPVVGGYSDVVKCDGEFGETFVNGANRYSYLWYVNDYSQDPLYLGLLAYFLDQGDGNTSYSLDFSFELELIPYTKNQYDASVSAIEKQTLEIKNQTQQFNNQFNDLKNGFDSSAGDSMNDGFSASLNDYETSQDSLFTAAQSGLNGFTFVDFSSYPALVTSMSFVTSLMTGFFGAMGGESGPVGIILSVLFSVMLVSMAIGLYRFYSGKKDGDG